MLTFTIRRLLTAIPTLLLISLVIFLLVDFAPGGTVIARFFFIKDPDGYEIEVLQRESLFIKAISLRSGAILHLSR